MATWKDRIQFFNTPRLADSVHREECTQCFESQDSEEGVDVCLSCFNGGCLSKHHRHARTHFEKTKHPLSLNIKRRPKPRRDEREPPTKRLAIQEERDEDNYTYTTSLRSWTEGDQLIPEAVENDKVKALIDGVMSSMSSARQSEVKAWEEEITTCEHTLTLQQASSGHIQPSGLAHCLKCELGDNLWLCLACGSLGCGRQQFGGIAGNGHGLSHYEDTGHPVAVKLGTITAEGGADIYCYKCNDSRLDPELSAHLGIFGINVAQQTKTQKTITELQIEQNFKFDFSLTGEDGKALEPLFGPGLTGLSNLGNSCYMASILQTLFSLPSFQARYWPVPNAAAQHAIKCKENLPASCVECQMYKIADGLLSGRYSRPRSQPLASPDAAKEAEQESPIFQEGIKPTMFKHLIGAGHAEFSTMKQQDAEEFFTYLLKVLRQQYRRDSSQSIDPTEVFRHGIEQRLECSECHRVSYRVDAADVLSVPVPSRPTTKTDDGKQHYDKVQIMECIDQFTGQEALDYRCPSCDKKVVAIKRSKFSTFPSVLVIHARKFELVNWVPQKLNIPLQLPASGEITLDAYLGTGQLPNEELLPLEPAVQSINAAPTYDPNALALLESMGFSLVRSQKALLATGNSDGQAAMEWLFEHMEDPDIDEPMPVAVNTTKASTGAEPSTETVSMLADMGFTSAQAKKALRETGGDPERAVEWLFSHPDDTGAEDTLPIARKDSLAIPGTSIPGGSAGLPATYRLKAFISHKGPSVHSGHYVAHVRTGKAADATQKESEWVFFNDEKVVKADAESVDSLMPYAYLYVFERV